MYKIIIERDEVIIFETPLKADQVIDTILSFTVNPLILEDPEDSSALVKEVSEKKKYNKKRPVDESAALEQEIAKTRKPPTCSNCGKVGHRSHLCPNDKKSPEVEEIDEDAAVENGALDRMQFTQVKDLKHQEMSAKEISEELDVDRTEVQHAFGALTYEGYLKLR